MRRLAKPWRVVRRPWMGRILDESGVMLRTTGEWKIGMGGSEDSGMMLCGG